MYLWWPTDIVFRITILSYDTNTVYQYSQKILRMQRCICFFSRPFAKLYRKRVDCNCTDALQILDFCSKWLFIRLSSLATSVYRYILYMSRLKADVALTRVMEMSVKASQLLGRTYRQAFWVLILQDMWKTNWLGYILIHYSCLLGS